MRWEERISKNSQDIMFFSCNFETNGYISLHRFKGICIKIHYRKKNLKSYEKKTSDLENFLKVSPLTTPIAFTECQFSYSFPTRIIFLHTLFFSRFRFQVITSTLTHYFLHHKNLSDMKCNLNTCCCFTKLQFNPTSLILYCSLAEPWNTRPNLLVKGM